MFDVIFDLDGTLANNEHRKHWITVSPKNWEAWNAETMGDSLIWQTKIALTAFHKAGSRIIVCTARGEECRDLTMRWLEKYDIWQMVSQMYMRPPKDFRKDCIVKSEMLDQLRKDGYDPKMVFDDRKQVKRMWVDRGIFVFDVNQHDEEY